MIATIATLLMTRANLGPKAAKLASWGIIMALAAILLFGAYRLITGNDKVKARLGANQTEAALESGGDAVDTVGKAGTRDAQTDRVTAENDAAIRAAEGSAAPVSKPANDAGHAALCRRAAYKDDPRCAK